MSAGSHASLSTGPSFIVHLAVLLVALLALPVVTLIRRLRNRAK